MPCPLPSPPSVSLSLGIVCLLLSSCAPLADKAVPPGESGEVSTDTDLVPDEPLPSPAIVVTPAIIGFGDTYVGCDFTSVIGVANVGTADLSIHTLDFTSAGTDLSFDPNESVNGALPWILPPGGSADVSVSYVPRDERPDDGRLTVGSDDPLRPLVEVPQTGSATVYGVNVDAFVQGSPGAVDILFILDNSCSMDEAQAEIAARFSEFGDALEALDADYQIAVITTDSPVFQGPILDRATIDLVAAFAVHSAVGVAGSGTERPSEMAYQAALPGGDAGVDGEFLRVEAGLSLIFVSNEPDSSPSAWAHYLSHFESLKTDRSAVVAHAISGDWPGGCGGASATNNVYEMTVATGGLYLSICEEDWSAHMESLGEASVGVAETRFFELSAWPIPDTVVVRVDGVETLTGWAYDEASRSAVFEEAAVPGAGATVEVEYTLFGDCE